MNGVCVDSPKGRCSAISPLLLPSRSPMQKMLRNVRHYESSGRLHQLVREYLRLGTLCMERNEPNLAYLYLNRCAVITDYERQNSGLLDKHSIEECKSRIQKLEEGPLFTTDILREVREKAHKLEPRLVRIWAILSFCRMSRLGARFAKIRECKPFGKAGKVAQLLYPPREKRLKRREFKQLDTLIAWVEEWGKDYFFYGANYITGPYGPVQILDLIGMNGIRSLYWFLEYEYRNFDNELKENDAFTEPDFIPVTLLPDYYLRRCGEDLSKVPLLQEELDRIRSDYDFLALWPTEKQIEARMDQYVVLDILS